VFPRPTQSTWYGPDISSFVEQLRAIAASAGGVPARVAGALPLSADILAAMSRDGPLVSLLALLGVVLVVVVLFRASLATPFVIGSLLIGVGWMLAATIYLGVRINFINLIAFPITFGIGVDYAVNVMGRYLQDGRSDVTAAISATGGAVSLCSATTIIGYSSLLVAQNRGLFLFGLFASWRADLPGHGGDRFAVGSPPVSGLAHAPRGRRVRVAEVPSSPSPNPTVPGTFSRNTLTSIFTTALDFFTLTGLVEFAGVNYVLATWIGTIVGSLSNFSINRWWSFRASGQPRSMQFLRFVLVQVGASGLHTAGSGS